MWTPDSIHIKNLFAHVDTKYKFHHKVCTVIFGENRDDDDSDNNGAGKSTIFEAIAIALTGKSLRDIDKEVFINRHSDDCEVEFCLFNAAMNSSLKIVRKFFRGGKSTKVEIYENGERNAQLVSVNEANQRITELIGISRDDLMRYFIISQDNRYQFFTAGDTEKKEVLNRITNANMIDPIIEKLAADKKELANSANDISVDIKRNESKIEIYQEQIKEANENTNTDEIKAKEAKIKSIGQQIVETEKQISENSGTLETLKSKTASYNIPDVAAFETKKKVVRKAIKELENKEFEAERIIRDLKQEISGAVKCPECGHDFIPDSKYDITLEEAKQLIAETESKLKEIKDAISEKNAKLDSIVKQIDQAERLKDELRRLNGKINSLAQDIESKKLSIKSFNKRIENLQNEIAEMKENSRSVKIIKQATEKIAEIEAVLNEQRRQLSEIEQNQLMVDYWIYYMGKNGFATYLANKSIKIIEGITNSFLKRFRSSMSVEINGFKANKDGSVREKIDVLAVYKGRYAQNFMGYSGGERSKIFLASILGIQHLINLSLGDKGLDLLLLDESLGALDSRGVVNICNILNQLGVTMMMITQNVSNDVNISNKILVVREDETSKIIV